jgi:Asp-tRNA(Asn)/Glu-tRNA(Gln) amidotransferase C subunit
MKPEGAIYEREGGSFMPLSKKELKKLSELSCIAVKEEEQEALFSGLCALCLLADRFVKEAPAEEPVLLDSPFSSRADEVHPFEHPEALLENAPKKKDGFLVLSVKKEEDAP